MPSYEEMLEYILESDQACRCCKCNGWCNGVSMTPSGPSFPPCADKDFGDLLNAEEVQDIYTEDHADDREKIT